MSYNNKIELLSAWFCPYAQRTWIALEAKCSGKFTVTESIKIIPPKCFEKTDHLLEKNAKGLVPVIIDKRGDEEVVVCESIVCVEYVDEAIGAPILLTGSPSQRAHARMWADKLNNEICTQFYTLLKKQDAEWQEKAADKMLTGIREFSEECKGPFFYGDDISLVDIAIAPWAAGIRMDVLKHYRNFEVPKTEKYATYWKWVDAMSKDPSFIATASNDLRAMIDVYIPYAEGAGYSSIQGKGSKWKKPRVS